MSYPNIWGQGQLFALSALDGESFFSDDMVGTLSGDRIAVRFFLKCKRELALVNTKIYDPYFEVVASDTVILRDNARRLTAKLVYAERHLVIGDTGSLGVAAVLVEGDFERITADKITLHDTGDGQVTALAVCGCRFAFAYGHSRGEAEALALRGLELDLDAIISSRLSVYDKEDSGEFAPLRAKCISVMKSQLYSPEGKFKTIWSTPDRLPHRHLWLWDSVFHAIGHRHLDIRLAEGLVTAIFANQREDGFIPHMASVGVASEVSQPPIIAWGSWRVYELSGNDEFLSEVYSRNRDFLAWCRRARRDASGLYVWLTDADKNCRCGESGMDNSPRFDTPHPLGAVDFCSYVANDLRYMEKIARKLGRDAEAEEYMREYASLSALINEKMWSEEDGFYYDYDLETGSIRRVEAVAGFLPLFAGVCPRERAEALICALHDERRFGGYLPVPSISRADATFGKDMWRGPVWINCNYMIITGLRESGFDAEAESLARRTLGELQRWYLRRGAVYEFYSSDGLEPHSQRRKGDTVEPYSFEIRMQSIRDYGWSCTLGLDLIESI